MLDKFRKLRSEIIMIFGHKLKLTRRASLVSDSYFFYKNEGLGVKDGWCWMKGEGWRVKYEGLRMEG